MKKTAALLTLLSLLFLLLVETVAGHVVRSAPLLHLSGLGRMQAPPQAARSPIWQSREEYDAFQAITERGKSPEMQIALAEAFIQRFPQSDFRSEAYLKEMQCYYQLNRVDPAVDAARKVLRRAPDNLEALTFLSYVFPFMFRSDSPAARSNLILADDNAHRGLDALERLQRPANVSPEQFLSCVREKRAIFNSAMGFVALQRKDYANAITALTAAGADNPRDIFTFYRLGLAYLFSTPADYDHGIWYLARAAGLARASKNPSRQDILSYLRKVFVQAVGSDAAVENTITEALASVNPPDGSDRPAAARGGIGLRPSGSAITSFNANPSALPATRQTSNVTISRVYAPIYPTWLPASENEAGDQAPPPPPAAPAYEFAGQSYDFAGDMSMVGQEQPWQYAPAPAPPEPPEPEPPLPATVLVYKDGHQVEVQDYAIVGGNLVWISGNRSKKIPLADLDLPATRKVNEDHGVTFGAPDAR